MDENLPKGAKVAWEGKRKSFRCSNNEKLIACLQSERWDARCSVAAELAVVTTSVENKGHASRNVHRAATSNACYKIDAPFQICDIFVSP